MKAGYVALVDGTFLKRWQRSLFQDLARDLGVPFIIVAVSAPEPIMRARILERSHRQNDASEADIGVLDHQLSVREPLGSDERSIRYRMGDGRRR